MSFNRAPLFGLLNVHKPSGITSRDAVNRIQRIVRPTKVGHAGTLDPLASGVLVVCLGAATRLVSYVQQMPKHYTATFLLGRESDTEDIQGNVIEKYDRRRLKMEDIQPVFSGFLGDIRQRPPSFSAVKVKGKRAYNLARAGQQVQLEERVVTIHALNLVSYDFPEFTLDIKCSSGTYVRSLGRDIAKQLGTCAVMSALVRNSVGRFHIDDAIELENITTDSIYDQMLPPLRAVSNIPQTKLTPAQIDDVVHGRTIPWAQPVNEGEVAGLDSDGNLIAILVPRGDGLLGPIRNFHGRSDTEPT